MRVICPRPRLRCLFGRNLSHFYTASAQQVKAVIQFLKPKAVFLELCASRLNSLRPPQKQEEPTLADVVKEWRRNGNFLDVYVGWLYSKRIMVVLRFYLVNQISWFLFAMIV